MKHTKKFLNKMSIFVRNNYLIVLFGFIVLIVGGVLLLKFLTQDEKTIYVKVKVSQGLWWASTLKPSVWLAESLQKGDKEINLSRESVSEIMEVRRYPLLIPNYSSEQYDVFLTVKMRVDFNDRTKKYTFKRSNLTIGGPIEYEFQDVSITGTIVDISERPFNDIYEEKIITLEKELAQEWEYNAIIIGDTYFDGEDVIIEILDKDIITRYAAVIPVGTNYQAFPNTRLNIQTTVKMKLKKDRGTYIFREELPIILGKRINLSFIQGALNDFTITNIR